MAAWDKDLDDSPRPAWEKDLDAPEKKPKKSDALEAVKQFAIGTADPLLGLTQRLGSANPFARQAFPVLSTFAAMAKPAVDEGLAQSQPEGFGEKSARFAGNILSPLSLGVAKMDIPASLAGRTALGAGVGAAGGYTAPAASEEEARRNAGIGAAVGGIAVPVIQGVGNVANWLSKRASETYDLFRSGDEGAKNILRRYVQSPKVVGQEGMPKVIEATRNAEQIIPGSKPTVAQAVAGLPEGSPLSRLEEITSKTSGGPSARFGERIRDQNFAKQVAEEVRDEVTSPMREVALNAANRAGGVKTNALLGQIDKMATKEGDRASDVVSKTLGTIRSKIETLGPDGRINAKDLYTIRKEIGNTIQSHAKETANWDKNLAAKLERSIQMQIDDAIEASGGKGWRQYLSEYAGRSKAIDADVARRELAANPLQSTNLGGGLNIAEETRQHLPNLLSRPAMVMNYFLKAQGRGIEPKVDALAAELMLNPRQFAEEMSRLPPEAQINISNALRRANALSFGVGASQ